MEYTNNSLEQHWMPFTANRDFKADPRIVVKSEGMYYIDHKGGSVLDGCSGLFCAPLGHGRPEIANAVRDQLLTNDYAPPFQVGHPGLIRAGKPDCTDHTRANQSCVLCELWFRID